MNLRNLDKEASQNSYYAYIMTTRRHTQANATGAMDDGPELFASTWGADSTSTLTSISALSLNNGKNAADWARALETDLIAPRASLLAKCFRRMQSRLGTMPPSARRDESWSNTYVYRVGPTPMYTYNGSYIICVCNNTGNIWFFFCVHLAQNAHLCTFYVCCRMKRLATRRSKQCNALSETRRNDSACSLMYLLIGPFIGVLVWSS